jgi:hypothetical protein
VDLARFIHTVSTRPDDIRQFRVVQLIADSYPFFLLHALRQRNGHLLQFHTVDVQREEMSALIARLTTTFLGASYQYWIVGHDSLSSKKAHLFVEFLKCYDGPHTLILIAPNPYKLSSESTSIVLDDKFDKRDLAYLASFFGVKERGWMNQLPALASIDQVCMLLYYAILGGEVYRRSSWMARLITIPPALFTISQHFFAQKPRDFFALWKEIEPLYTMPFWISFWSDQLWRAFFYVRYMRAQQSAKAKQYTYRLPFSFIKKDWCLYELEEELINAHNWVYEVDFLSKNGVSALGLELLYSTFFLRRFRP